jgi:predicted methyltransferase
MKTSSSAAWVVAVGLVFAGATCSAGAGGEASTKAIADAIASAERLPPDREQDERRKPDAILAFLAVGPGMHVIDVFSAGGYYSELLARVVGAKGEVIAYNNPPYAKFAEKGIAARYAGNRLPNVRQVTGTIEDLDLAPGSLDAAIFVMSYHDLYWRPADGSWPPTDPALLLRKLKAALKPGGIVVVQDHVANPGGDPAQVVDALHRIDPALVKRDFEQAGFVPDGQSDVLAHPADDHSKLVFDESIRGKTDQFVFRFRKPRG